MRLGRFLSVQQVHNDMTSIYNSYDLPLDRLNQLLGNEGENWGMSIFTLANQDIPDGVDTELVWTAAVTDILGMWDDYPSNPLLTPTGGVYSVNLDITWSDSNAGYRTAYVVVGAAGIIRGNSDQGEVGILNHVASGICRGNADGLTWARVMQNTGAQRTIQSATLTIIRTLRTL